MRTTRLVGSYALILGSFTQSGCLVRKVNQLWPPKPPCQNQLEAIRLANANLTRMERVDLFASVSTADLNQYVPAPLLAALPGMTKVNLKTDLQEIVLALDFDKEFDDANLGKVRLVGTATVNGAVGIQGENLVILPSFNTFHLKKIVVKRRSIPPELINAILKLFLNNINGAIRSQKIALRLSILEKLSPIKLLRKEDGFMDVSGKDIDLVFELDRASVFIDNVAVRTVAKLKDNQPPQDEPKVSKTAVPGNTCPTLVPEFNTFRDTFTARARQDLGDVATVWNGTAAAVSKKYVASLANNTLSHLDFAAGYILPAVGPLYFAQIIKADPAPDLNCQHMAEQISCDIAMECSQSRDCNPHWDCPDCAWYDVGCHARKAGCEIDKARYRGQCELEKEATRQGCEVNKAALKVQCEVSKQAKLRACELNQAWLNAWSGAEFGAISGNASMSPTDVRAVISGISLPEDLSGVSVHSSVSANANFTASFDLKPYGAGYIACQVPWSGDVSFGVSVPILTLNVSALIKPGTQATDGVLPLELTTAEQTLTLRTSSPPILALLTQNPSFVIKCFPATAALGAGVFFSQKLREDLIKDSFEYKVPSFHLPLSVQPIGLTLGDNAFALTPSWGDRSVQFTMSKPK